MAFIKTLLFALVALQSLSLTPAYRVAIPESNITTYGKHVSNERKQIEIQEQQKKHEALEHAINIKLHFENPYSALHLKEGSSTIEDGCPGYIVKDAAPSEDNAYDCERKQFRVCRPISTHPKCMFSTWKDHPDCVPNTESSRSNCHTSSRVQCKRCIDHERRIPEAMREQEQEQARVNRAGMASEQCPEGKVRRAFPGQDGAHDCKKEYRLSCFELLVPRADTPTHCLDEQERHTLACKGTMNRIPTNCHPVENTICKVCIKESVRVPR